MEFPKAPAEQYSVWGYLLYQYRQFIGADRLPYNEYPLNQVRKVNRIVG